MTLPKEIRDQIKRRLEVLLVEISLLLSEMTDENARLDAELESIPFVVVAGASERRLFEERFYNLKTRCLVMLDFMKNYGVNVSRLSDEITPLENTTTNVQRLSGVMNAVEEILHLEQPLRASLEIINLAHKSSNHIFVSYGSNDIDFCRGLRVSLEAQGFEIWLDEKRLQPGIDWWDEIEQNIDSCAAFIIVMSYSSRNSFYVKAELFRALDKKKPIFPLLLEGKTFSLLAALQYENMQYGKNTLSENFISRLRHTTISPLPLDKEPENLQLERESDEWGLSQVEHLLSIDNSNSNDYASAAVLLGVILEKVLRKLAENNAILLLINGGRPKSSLVLASDLRQADILNGLKFKQIQSWIEMRNLAVHGGDSEFSREDVDNMHKGISEFLKMYFKR